MITNDSATKKDSLGREKFAKQIVTSLTTSFDDTDDSMVVGICGSWGSGKSTLLNFIENEIGIHYANNTSGYRIIHFNPWETSGIEELQRNLLETIIKELETIEWNPKAKNLLNNLKLFSKNIKYFKFLKYTHPVAEKIIEGIEQFSETVTAVSLEDLRKQINEAIAEIDIRLYIFIDDLDRLDPSEITGIFKTIKLNVNFTNTFFIVAYDKEVVINGLTFQFGKNAESYLEKIIQVDFNIPEILEEVMENIFFEKLETFLLMLNLPYDKKEIYSIWKHRGLREYFQTLRDIKRYFNSLAFSLPNIGKEINVPDFISLEALKVFDFPSYEGLYLKVIEMRRKALWSTVALDKIQLETFTNRVTQSILGYLFPENQKFVEQHASINKKRLRDEEMFPRYYSLNIPSKDIHEETLVNFLTPNSNKGLILSHQMNNGRMENLLRRLGDDKLKERYSISDFSVFKSILDFWKDHEDEMNIMTQQYVWNAYFNLAHSAVTPYDAAKAAVAELFLTTDEHHSVKLLFNQVVFQLKEENRNDPQFYKMVDEQLNIGLPHLKDAFIKNINQNAPSYFYKTMRTNNYFLWGSILYSIAKYCADAYSPLIDQYHTNSHFLAFLLKAKFVRIDISTQKPFNIDLGLKELFLPNNYFENAIQKLSSLNVGEVPAGDQAIIDFFLSSLPKQLIKQ